MSRGPSDRELDRLLAGLPRAGASPDFTGRVLAELARPAPARPAAPRRWLLAGAAAALAAAAFVWLLPRAAVETPPAAEVQLLREEYRQMMEELMALKATLRRSEPPVLYLGGTESLDLVLDLGPLLESGAGSPVRPAALGADAPAPFPLDPRSTQHPDGGNPR